MNNKEFSSGGATRGQKPHNYRIAFLVVVCIFLLALCGGSLPLLQTLWSDLSQTTASAQTNHGPNALHTKQTASLLPSPTPSPTPEPQPLPLQPFPVTEAEQVATLKAHDRFLVHGNNALPEVSITFDDGPNPPYTQQILAILKRYAIKATFFCKGTAVQEHPELVQEAYQQGHTIGNHTWSHPFMPALSEESTLWQLTTSSNMLRHLTGVYQHFFRPPYGAYNSTTLKVVNTFGMSTIIWNVDPNDWALPGAATITARVLAQAINGSIILLHDGGGDRSETVAALPGIIEGLRARGLHFVTLKEMIDHLHTASPQGTPAATATPAPSATPILEPTQALPADSAQATNDNDELKRRHQLASKLRK